MGYVLWCKLMHFYNPSYPQSGSVSRIHSISLIQPIAMPSQCIPTVCILWLQSQCQTNQNRNWILWGIPPIWISTFIWHSNSTTMLYGFYQPTSHGAMLPSIRLSNQHGIHPGTCQWHMMVPGTQQYWCTTWLLLDSHVSHTSNPHAIYWFLPTMPYLMIDC